MGLQNGTLMDGATFTVNGGTSKTLSVDGQQVTGGIHLQDASVTDFRTRPNATVKTKLPVLGSDGYYGKGKKSFTIVHPKVLANGKQGFPLIRIELEDYPEMSQAEVDKLLIWGTQILCDADFQTFWRTGSLA